MRDKHRVAVVSRGFFSLVRRAAAWPFAHLDYTRGREWSERIARLFPYAATRATELHVCVEFDVHVTRFLRFACRNRDDDDGCRGPRPSSSSSSSSSLSSLLETAKRPLLLRDNLHVRALTLRAAYGDFSAATAARIFQRFPRVERLDLDFPGRNERGSIVQQAFRWLPKLVDVRVTGGGHYEAYDVQSISLPPTLLAYRDTHVASVMVNLSTAPSPVSGGGHRLHTLELATAQQHRSAYDERYGAHLPHRPSPPTEWLSQLPCLSTLVYAASNHDTDWYRAVALHPSLTHLDLACTRGDAQRAVDAAVLQAAEDEATVAAESEPADDDGDGDGDGDGGAESKSAAVTVVTAVPAATEEKERVWPIRPNMRRLIHRHLVDHDGPWGPGDYGVSCEHDLAHLAAFPNLEALVFGVTQTETALDGILAAVERVSPAVANGRLAYLGFLGQAPVLLGPPQFSKSKCGGDVSASTIALPPSLSPPSLSPPSSSPPSSSPPSLSPPPTKVEDEQDDADPGVDSLRVTSGSPTADSDSVPISRNLVGGERDPCAESKVGGDDRANDDDGVVDGSGGGGAHPTAEHITAWVEKTIPDWTVVLMRGDCVAPSTAAGGATRDAATGRLVPCPKTPRPHAHTSSPRCGRGASYPVSYKPDHPLIQRLLRRGGCVAFNAWDHVSVDPPRAVNGGHGNKGGDDDDNKGGHGNKGGGGATCINPTCGYIPVETRAWTIAPERLVSLRNLGTSTFALS
jgi:hypothetical protein